MPLLPIILFFFFFNDTATTEIYTLSLHDALPISAYKIAHSAIYTERGEILRQRGVVAQAPFIEATPAFPTAHKLMELEQTYPHIVPSGLAALVQHGVPVDRFPLYTHQEEALLTAYGDHPNLLL